SGYELVAEVRVDTKDSGYVNVGSQADVKFATYDSALFGTLTGVVERVSATTFQPQPGQPSAIGQTTPEPYYKAVIRLSSDHLGRRDRVCRVEVGVVDGPRRAAGGAVAEATPRP